LPQRAEGDVYRARPITGSEFVGRIARKSSIGGRPAIVPIISGRGWITGVGQYMLDPADPWPVGIPALGYMAAHEGGNLSAWRGSRGSVDAEMAMKLRLHDLLSAPQSNFKRFASRLA
jgi:hypothetical protein